MKPATSSCRAFCAAFIHGQWPRPRALGPGRPAVENCSLRGAKPPGAVGCSPRQGAWQAKPATSSCRASCAASTHGRWARPRALGPPRPAVENCSLRGAKPPGAVPTSPRQGALQTKPATSSCRAFCAASTHERWPRPRAMGLRRPAVENCGLHLRNRQGRFSAAPARGLGKRSPRRRGAGRIRPMGGPDDSPARVRRGNANSGRVLIR